MKWFFILLLVANVSYLGWEIDRSTKLDVANQREAIRIPAGTQRLALVSELEQQPNRRQSQSDEESNYDLATVLPIEMNPNTENMIEALLNDSAVMQMDNGFMADEIDDLAPGLTAADSRAVCYTYGPIPDSSESALMADWLNERGIDFTQRQTAEEGEQKFWVYLAPQASRAEAEATLADLKQQGIDDLHLIRSGDLLNAVSLGLFSSQASVNRRLNEIEATGYQPIVVPYSGGKQIYWFDVRIVQNSSYVNDLFTGFPARFNALPVNCNEIAMQ